MQELVTNVRKVLDILKGPGDVKGKGQGISKQKAIKALQEVMGFAQVSNLFNQALQNLEKSVREFQGNHFNRLFNKVEVISELLIQKGIYTKEEYDTFHRNIAEQPVKALNWLQYQVSVKQNEVQKIQQEFAKSKIDAGIKDPAEWGENPRQEEITALSAEIKELQATQQVVQTTNYTGEPVELVEQLAGELDEHNRKYQEDLDKRRAEAQRLMEEKKAKEEADAAEQQAPDEGPAEQSDEESDTVTEEEPTDPPEDTQPDQ